MRVHDAMTFPPAICSADADLTKVARLMAECDCGEIPLSDPFEDDRIIGVVTDRDIVCRAVAAGKASQSRAQEIMTSPAITVEPGDDLDRAIGVMVRNQVRRLPVVDERGVCIGIVSHTDVARVAPSQVAGDLEPAFVKRRMLVYDD